MKKLFVISWIFFFGYPGFCQQLSPYDFPPGEAGLQALGAYLLQADITERQRLTYELLPKKGEYLAVFQEAIIKDLQRYHKKWYRSVSPTIGPRDEKQNQLLIQQINRDSLLSLTEGAIHFPGGYREIADWFLPDVTLYRLQFVEAGARLGTAFDVFVYLDDHWRVFPHPWKAKKL